MEVRRARPANRRPLVARHEPGPVGGKDVAQGTPRSTRCAAAIGGARWTHDNQRRLWAGLQAKAVAGSSIKNRVTETPKVASTDEAEAHFKQLLVDAGVRPTQKWKDVYKELMTDGRFKLLKSGRRKQVCRLGPETRPLGRRCC